MKTTIIMELALIVLVLLSGQCNAEKWIEVVSDNSGQGTTVGIVFLGDTRDEELDWDWGDFEGTLEFINDDTGNVMYSEKFFHKGRASTSCHEGGSVKSDDREKFYQNTDLKYVYKFNHTNWSKFTETPENGWMHIKVTLTIKDIISHDYRCGDHVNESDLKATTYTDSAIEWHPTK